MSDHAQLVKAQFQELDSSYENVLAGSQPVPVQFNPETLKVSFANALVEPKSGGDQRGQQARQFVGAGTIKLALQLWFDVTAPPYSTQGLTDVRKLSQAIAYFITPKAATDAPSGSAKGADQTQYHPPCVRFVWGTFQFDGMMDSLEESLEFFSADGKPLRANLSVALSRQRITAFFKQGAATRAPSGGAGPATGPSGLAPGTARLTAAIGGASLQQLADMSAPGVSWQTIASANGIENPRNLAAGTLIDLNAGVGGSASIGVRLGGN